MEAKGQAGTITTRPFKLGGNRLQVNVKGQEFAVEVLDAEGEPLPGFSVSEAGRHRSVDQLRLEPTWRGRSKFSSLKGQIVRFRFHLENAVIYSFQVLPSSD